MLMLVVFVSVFLAGFLAAWIAFAATEKAAKKSGSSAVSLLRGIFARLVFLSKPRALRFEEILPEALDSLANSLKSGSSLIQGIGLIVSESPRPVSTEFESVLKEMRLGLSLEESLENLADRIKNGDLDLAVTAISVSQKTGGSLSETLVKISSIIRDRNKVLGKAKALTSQGKMQALIVGLLPVVLAVLILFVDPAFIMPLFTRPMGWAMLLVAAVMEFLGIVFLRKIITIEV